MLFILKLMCFNCLRQLNLSGMTPTKLFDPSLSLVSAASRSSDAGIVPVKKLLSIAHDRWPMLSGIELLMLTSLTPILQWDEVQLTLHEK